METPASRQRNDHQLHDRRPIIPCKVCGDRSSGKHYGVFTCDGCRGFFKRSVRRNLTYHCKEHNQCPVDVSRRNQCQACRLRKCFQVKMKKDAVQHERAPRTSQILPRNSPTIPMGSFESPLNKAGQLFPGMENKNVRLLGNGEQEMSKSAGLSFPPSTAASHYHSVSPPGYHGQNNNQSPDLCSKKQSFVSITSLIDTNENTKSSSSTSANVVSSEKPLGSRPTAVGIPQTMFQQCAENVYESAVQLLYNSVTWARNIPTFLDLPFRDQAILLEEGWSELFVLSTAQFSLPLDMGPLLNAAGLQVDKAPTDKIVAGMADIRLLQNIVNRFKRIQIDPTEYACLKAIVLFKPECVRWAVRHMKSINRVPFKPSDLRGLRDPHMVEQLQDQAQAMLGEYCRRHCPEQQIRFGKLLLLLPSLRTAGPKMIENLFFKGTLDNVPIERMLCDMFKSS